MMEAAFLVGLTCLCSPLMALVLDFNTIRGSGEVYSSKKSAQCLTDKDCPAGRFCHSPQEQLLPFCATCHGLRRRCQRDSMCCSGMLCVNDVCSPGQKTALVEEGKRDGRARPGTRNTPPRHSAQAGHGTKKGNPEAPSDQAREGESCLRTSDCAPGFCCARHFWAKICKPVLAEGQVCSRRGQKEGAQGPEIFQRCDCGPGLTCQMPLGGMPHRARLRVCQRH